MKFEIKNRFSGDVQFTAEIDADEITSESVKIGLAVRCALKAGADIWGVSLGGVEGEKIEIQEIPIQILTEEYSVIIFDSHMQIGCEFHSLADWWGFDNKRIAEMDGIRAAHFWKTWKAPLKAICEANGRGK